MKLPHLARSYVRDESFCKFFWKGCLNILILWQQKIIFNLLICSAPTFVNLHSLNSFYFLSPRKVIRARVISIFFENVWQRTFFMGFFLFLDTHWVGHGGVMDFIKWNLSRVIIFIVLHSYFSGAWVALSFLVSESVCLSVIDNTRPNLHFF